MTDDLKLPPGFAPEADGVHYIFRPWRRLPDGTILWAKNFGKKAWRIPVTDGAPPPSAPPAPGAPAV